MSWLQLLAQHHATWGKLLHVVFPFDTLPSPDHQDDELVEELRSQLLLEFTTAVEEGAAGVWRDQDKRALAAAVDQVARAELFVHADYGCVVVVHTQIGCWGEETAALEVIGLDQHAFAVHSSEVSGRAFTSTTGAPAELVAGCVPSLALPRMQEVVRQLLRLRPRSPSTCARPTRGAESAATSARPRSSTRSTPTPCALSRTVKKGTSLPPARQ
jgi:hypothetical protein